MTPDTYPADPGGRPRRPAAKAPPRPGLPARGALLVLLVAGIAATGCSACRGSRGNARVTEARQGLTPRRTGPDRAPADLARRPPGVPDTPRPAPGTLFHGRMGTLSPGQPLRGAEDLDGDGKADAWTATWHGGSGFGGVQLVLQSTRLGQTFTLDSDGSFGRFLHALRLPPALAALPPLVRGVVRLLYGESHLRQMAHAPGPRGAPAQGRGATSPRGGATQPAEGPDGSFDWLAQHHLFPALPPRAPFVEQRFYTPRWSAGPPRAPESQVVPLHRRRSWRLVKALHDGDGADLASGPPTGGGPMALLAYFAHHHGPLREVARCGGWTLHATNHGVAVVDATLKAHSWAYVSTGVQKLRWASLRGVACQDGLVVLERDTRERLELLVVDPMAGRTGRLPLGRGTRWRLEAKGSRLVVGQRAYLLAALRAALAPPKAWQGAYDLDGDGKADPIGVTFSGGAHCCYRLTLKSSRTGKAFPLPFQLDGGYVGGLDFSQPGRFHIADYDGDGLPDLFLEIETYNGAPGPLRPAWRRRWGLRSHHVVVSLRGGQLGVRDLE